jgi:hypothetical protein
MAVHARLSAPSPRVRREWLWHEAKWSAIPLHVLWSGDRRMEAETYLSSGYGLRIAIQERAVGWKRFKDLARVWHPPRLKGIQVSPEFGTPFLAATQVFEIRPVARKWLALERTEDAAQRFIRLGTILVTCSGSVGRATLAHAAHENTLITHDLLRIEPNDDAMWGWLYAYLRSPQARAMMSGVQYGHIIKHLETSHLDALPVPIVRDSIAADFGRQTREILDLRNRAHQCSLDAEARFERALGPLNVSDWGEEGFTVRASDSLFSGRRRFDAMPNNPGVATVRHHLAKQGQGFSTLAKAGFDVWVPGRYKRIPAEDGVLYYDSADLLEVCPDTKKRFADCRFGDDHSGRVKTGWLLMPCSGQVYGIIGSIVIAGEAQNGQVISNHVLRIAPKPDAQIRSGYLLTALSHPFFGRRLVKSLAFGSSVPELEPDDIRAFEVVRLPRREEDAIADLAEQSAAERAQADILERQLATDSDRLINRFLAGNQADFITSAPRNIPT